MKKIIKHIIKVTLTTVLLMVLFTGNISAEEIDWRNIGSVNFDGMENGDISPEYLSEITENFTATVNNGLLDISSDNLCWWQMNNSTSPNASGNGHDISVVNNQKIVYVETPVESTHGTFNYTSAGGDSGAYYISNIGGKDALKMLNYHCTANEKTRTNYCRFNIPQGKFTSSDNKFDVEIELYVEDYESSKKYVSFEYPGTDGTKRTIDLEKAVIEDGIECNWYTWKFTIEDADLTKYVYSNYSTGGDPATFYIRQPTYGMTTIAETYIHRVSIQKSSTDSLDFTDENKTVLYPITNESYYGNASLSFDMLLPEDELRSDNVFYNKGSNAMIVSLTNTGKTDIASLLIESNEDGQKIYSISEDSEGTKNQNLLYSGDILGMTLNYTIELDIYEKAYTVSIKKDDGSYLLEESEPFSINNLNSVGSDLIGGYISIKHNPRSLAMLSRFDNLSLDVQDDIEYTNCKKDLDAIVLEIPQNNIVSDDFALVSAGPLFGNTIIWQSDNTDVLAVNMQSFMAEVKCQSEKVDTVLTAKIETQNLVVVREFEITIDEHADKKKARQDAESLTLAVSENVGVKDDFELPLNSTNGTIDWYSDSSAIEIDGNIARVTRTAADQNVTLTARVLVGEFSAERVFVLEIPSIVGAFSDVNDVEKNVVVVEENGIVKKATLTVKYPANEGNLNFIAVSINGLTGEILNRTSVPMLITEQNKYSTITLEIENFSKNGGDIVKYYLLNDGFVSYENTAPTAVTELKAVDKVKGVSLQWEVPHDDYDALEYYMIYRNNELIGTSETNEYFDTSAVKGKNYQYKVLAVDTTDNESNDAIVTGKSSKEMYYISYDKYGKGDKVYLNGMEWFSFLTTGMNESYAFITEVTDSNGEKCYAAWKPLPVVEGKTNYIHCKTDKAYINSAHNELVIEFDYLDVTRDKGISLMYNSDSAERDTMSLVPANPNGTGEWKTAVVRLDDARFRNSTLMSGCDFAFSCGTNEMYIKEVRIIQAEFYD